MSTETERSSTRTSCRPQEDSGTGILTPYLRAGSRNWLSGSPFFTTRTTTQNIENGCGLRDMAQFGSAHVSGTWGRRFKSCYPDDKSTKKMIDILHNRLSITHFQNSWHYSPVVQWQNRCLLNTQFRFKSWRESQEQNTQVVCKSLIKKKMRQKCMQLLMLLWWNGIHSRLKICLPHGIKGSSPFRSTFVQWEHNGVCGGMVYTPGCGPGSFEDNASSSLVIHPDTGWQASEII